MKEAEENYQSKIKKLQQDLQESIENACKIPKTTKQLSN